MIRTSDDDFQDALDRIASDDLAEAIPLLAKVAAFDSGNETAYELWVACHIKIGRFARAIELADAGLAKGISPVEMHVQKCHALLLSNRLDDASREAEAALAIDPMSVGAVLALVRIKLSLDEPAEAIRICEDAVARNRDSELEIVLLGLLKESENYEAVIARARDFLRTHGRDADVLSMLGHAYGEQSDYRRAERAFRDAAELDPENVIHHVGVLTAMIALRNAKGLESYLKRLNEFDEDLAQRVGAEIKRLVEAAEEAP